MDSSQLKQRFHRVADPVDFASLRYLMEHNESLTVRQGVLEPPCRTEDGGAMITVFDRGGMGYAATSDVTDQGLRSAFQRAKAWAHTSAGKTILPFEKNLLPSGQGRYRTPVHKSWGQQKLQDKITFLQSAATKLKVSEKIADWFTHILHVENHQIYLTLGGAEIEQHTAYLMPTMGVTAYEGGEAVSRSYGAGAYTVRGGLEVLDQLQFADQAQRVAEEALELLKAPNCPTGVMDLLLAPDQMILQIHESIGHPLELDRILGDERNFAGTSFVTPDMFGRYQYGSPLLNITFDPTLPSELASYDYDDDGCAAERHYLIEKGILKRGIGGVISQKRSGLPGVSSARADSWNRPPIDRMGNINLEPGTSSFADMVAAVDRGIYMETNTSWSIDDSRNKFQFGCEYGRRIEGGKLGGLVKKPNYRGLSADFWRNLKMVGDRNTWRVMGTPYCGKGEPNQVIEVGHASPACLFASVQVFGGEL